LGISAVVLVVSGCSGGNPTTKVEERSWDVTGTVVHVQRGLDFEASSRAITLGGRHSPEFSLGPMELALADGTILRVPAATPGGNACIVFMSDAEKLEATGLPAPEGLSDQAVAKSIGLSRAMTCTVIAELSEAGTVERSNGSRSSGRRHQDEPRSEVSWSNEQTGSTPTADTCLPSRPTR
jgi:hypothetical protein